MHSEIPLFAPKLLLFKGQVSFSRICQKVNFCKNTEVLISRIIKRYIKLFIIIYRQN